MCLITGQRKTDLLNMRWDQVYGDGTTYKLIRYRSTKNQKDLSIPVPGILDREIQALSRNRNGSPWLFQNPDTGLPMTDLKNPLATASRKLGLKPVTLHMIRHLAADGIMEVTGHRADTQAYMGWSSPNMVDIYTNAPAAPVRPPKSSAN